MANDAKSKFENGEDLETVQAAARKFLRTKLDEYSVADPDQRVAVSESTDTAIAETFARFTKEKERNEYKAFLQRLEDEAYQAMVKRENYGQVWLRTKAAYDAGVLKFLRQKRLSEEDLEKRVERAFKRAKKEREEKVTGSGEAWKAWSDQWFTDLPQAYRAALDMGRNAEDIRREMIAVLEAQLGSVHDENVQRFARRRFELILGDALTAWKQEGGLRRAEIAREKAQDELRDQEREAAREWFTAGKPSKKMQDLTGQGHNREDAVYILQALLLDKIKHLESAERRRFLDRLDRAVAGEV